VGVPTGFDWVRRKNGDVVISHHGRRATVLRGRKADAFVDDAGDENPTGEGAQQLMARVTGNYKRGNERQGRRK